MQTFTKQLLSASSYGKSILVTGTTSATSTIIHSGTASPNLDEVWIYASNPTAAATTLSIEWGGTAATGDVTYLTLPSKAGRTLVTDGRLLSNGYSVTAFSSAASGAVIDGFVNRITA